MSKKTPPLTDEEIAREFDISPDSLLFDTARSLSRNRPDNTICDLPLITCPHCGEESRADDRHDVKAGDTWDCPRCGRTIHVTFVDHTIQVHLSTEPNA